MKKTWIILLASASMLLAATPEQVERYLLVSGSEDQLIEFEQQIDSMGQMFAAKGGDDVPLMQDSQMIPIRFREYIQKNLSEDEMDEVLDNYKHDVLRKIVSASVLMEEPDTIASYRQFLKQIKEEPLPANRTESVKTIIKQLYDEKQLIEFFDKMFLPMVKKMAEVSGQDISKKQIDDLGKRFVKKMRESNVNAMLFMTRDFSDDELQELKEVSGNSATSHETRAVFGGIVYALDEAMRNITNRFATMLQKRKHPATRAPVKMHEANTTAHKVTQ